MKIPLDQAIRIEGKRYCGLVIYENKILLMFRRKNGKEYYSLAGGHAQIGESGNETIIREMLEETNIEVTSAELIYQFINNYDQVENFVYKCEIRGFKQPELIGEEKEFNSEQDYFEPMWVELKKVKEIILYPLQLKDWIIKNVLEETNN